MRIGINLGFLDREEDVMHRISSIYGLLDLVKLGEGFFDRDSADYQKGSIYSAWRLSTMQFR